MFALIPYTLLYIYILVLVCFDSWFQKGRGQSQKEKQREQHGEQRRINGRDTRRKKRIADSPEAWPHKYASTV